MSLDAEAIDWEDSSEVGSPAEVFGGGERTCEADFTWDGEGFGGSIEPLAGDTTVTVELVLDHDSARWTARENRQGGDLEICRGFLEVDGTVTLRTADGTFDVESEVTLRTSEDMSVASYSFSQGVADHEGSLSIELADGESGSLHYEISGTGSACAGMIQLGVSTSSNGMGSNATGTFAQWSDSACPLGEAPFDLLEAGPDGASVADAIEEAWSDLRVGGRWLDGDAADLVLSVDVPGEVACREADPDGVVTVPVRATYSSSDGRMQEHTADASVRVALDAEGNARDLQFWLSEDQVCASESDTLDYEPADCAELEMTTVQLGINQEVGGEPGFSDEGLNVYFSPRGGGEAPPVDRLAL